MAAMLRAFCTFELCVCLMDYSGLEHGAWVFVNPGIWNLCRHLVFDLWWQFQSRADHEAELQFERHRLGLIDG